MLTYVYECTCCGEFEEQQSISEPALERCPTCGTAVRRVLAGGTSFIIKGGGSSASHCERDALLRAGDAMRQAAMWKMREAITMDKGSGFTSRLVHAGNHIDHCGSVVTPIYQTSTFAFESARQGAERFAGKADGYIYTRIGNPTVRALEDCVASLEMGVGAVDTCSGTIGADVREAMTRKLTGTPSFLVGGRLLMGRVHEAELERLLEATP